MSKVSTTWKKILEDDKRALQLYNEAIRRVTVSLAVDVFFLNYSSWSSALFTFRNRRGKLVTGNLEILYIQKPFQHFTGTHYGNSKIKGKESHISHLFLAMEFPKVKT